MTANSLQLSGSVGIAKLPVDIRARLASELPPHVHSILLARPTTHDSQRLLFSMAGRLARAGFEEWERICILEAWFADYYRTVGRREIERAVSRATGNLPTSVPKWPEPDAGLIAGVLARGAAGLEDLKSLSDRTLDDCSTDDILDALFSQTDLLCLATHLSSAVTDKRETFRGRAHQYQFIVPNPMSAPRGLTSDGKVSVRCLANVGPLAYQVVEFDVGTLDEQARMHLHLARMARLRLAVYSGNRSLHGWFDGRDWSESEAIRFRRYVAALGADRATFTPCQLVRMPNAVRDNGVRQSALFISSK